jgi:hypothetical protein
MIKLFDLSDVIRTYLWLTFFQVEFSQERKTNVYKFKLGS